MPRNWLLGDFNTDFLTRDNANTKKYVSFFRNNGLTQMIAKVTRPNVHKGTCIVWIVTNTPFVLHCGVSNVLISDHLTVFCICKKKRENCRTVFGVFRDLKNYSKAKFVQLLKNHNWNFLMNLNNPNDQWEQKTTMDILSIMCAFKRFKQLEGVKPWLTPEIYREIRYRERCLKLFSVTGSQQYFKLACLSRNKINVLIDKAKSNYFKEALRANAKNQKKFWRIIKNFTDNDLDKNAGSNFVDPITLTPISLQETPDFLNSKFVNIVERLNILDPANMYLDFQNLYEYDTELCFSNDLPSPAEILIYVDNIDLTKSSGVPDINIRQYVDLLEGIPDIICYIYNTSIQTGIFPNIWSKGLVSLIPKPGDLSDPGNWRAITLTSVFQNYLKK